MAKFLYRVYVLQLKSSVWTQAKYRKQNPGAIKFKKFLYVGYTYHSVQERVNVHLAGGRLSNKSVRDHFEKIRNDLVPELHDSFTMTVIAKIAEKKLAQRLRKKGFAVYQS